MQTAHHRRASLFPTVFAVTMIALAGFAVGCSDDDDPPPVSAISFYGTYTDPAGPGTISLTEAAPATSPSILGGGTQPVPIVGTLTLAGAASIPLDGVYFIDTGVLSFSTIDDAYSFVGDTSGGIASGTSSGPDGGGAFVLFLGGTPSNVGVYCSAAVCTVPPVCSAVITFDMAIAGGTALVVADLDGTLIPAIGTVSGSSVDFHITEGGENFTIDGTLSGSSITGTWFDAVNVESGTFSGSSSSCTAAAANRATRGR